MKQEKEFSKEFPSLQKIYNGWICEEDSGFYPDEIQKYCLDKQIVKKFLDRLQEIIGKKGINLTIYSFIEETKEKWGMRE